MKQKQIIDLSVPLVATPPDSMLKVNIEYINHKQGAQVFGSVFGLEETDFPDGNFAATENVALTTHSGTQWSRLRPLSKRPSARGVFFQENLPMEISSEQQSREKQHEIRKHNANHHTFRSNVDIGSAGPSATRYWRGNQRFLSLLVGGPSPVDSHSFSP